MQNFKLNSVDGRPKKTFQIEIYHDANRIWRKKLRTNIGAVRNGTDMLRMMKIDSNWKITLRFKLKDYVAFQIERLRCVSNWNITMRFKLKYNDAFQIEI